MARATLQMVGKLLGSLFPEDKSAPCYTYVLHGPPGVGKSSLAFKLAKKALEECSERGAVNALWIDLRGTGSLLEAARMVLQQVHRNSGAPPYEESEDVHKLLQQVEELLGKDPWLKGSLLILDNTEDLQRQTGSNESLKRLLECLAADHTRVVVTTRTKYQPSKGQLLSVKALEEEFRKK